MNDLSESNSVNELNSVSESYSVNESDDLDTLSENVLDTLSEDISDNKVIENRKRKGIIGFVVFVVAAAILFVMDRFVKAWAVDNLKDNLPKCYIGDNFELFYLENHGAAWGILYDKTFLLIGITVIISLIMLILYLRIPSGKRFLLINSSFILIISGALGNLYDRINFKYVIDYIYVKIIDFPVFNLADCFVTVGVFLLIISLFYYKEDEIF